MSKLYKCTICGEMKPSSEFTKNSSNKYRDGLACYCKPCKRAKRRQDYVEKKDQYLDTRYKYVYGISLEQAKEMYSLGCQICGTKDGKLCIDHDHETNKVRGCLCSNCNTGLGMFRDDPLLLKNAISYLIHN